MTVDVVFSEGTRGLRSTWWGDKYYEELVVSDTAVRMDRMRNGAPVLRDHGSESVDNVIGVVENARIEDGKAIASIRFTKSEACRDVVSKIQEGILRKISVGYFVYRYDIIEEVDKDIPVYRAVDWEPAEISFVCVPFDDQAQVRQVRSAPNTNFSLCEFPTNSKGVSMAKRADGTEEVVPQVEPKPVAVEPVVPAAAATETPAPAPVPAAASAVVTPAVDTTDVERKRICDILDAGKKANVSDVQVRALIDKGLTVEAAGEEIIKIWARSGTGGNLDNRVNVGGDKKIEIFARGISNALLHRLDNKIKLEDEGKEFRGMSLTEMARDMMSAHGFNTRGMTKSEVASLALDGNFWKQRLGAHGVDDFPNILADVMGKTLRKGYDQAPQTWRPFCRTVEITDFKDVKRTQLGESPALLEIGEHGEVIHGTIGDSKEVYALRRWGRQFVISFVAMVNDDLNAFARVPQGFGQAGANLESDLVYAILNNNAAMSDAVALFHGTHNNLGGAGAISETTLSEMRKLGRKQKGLDGVTLLNIMHKYLVVPAAKEIAAVKQVSAVVPNQSSGVNPFTGLYSVIAEPRLDATSETAWYAIAEPTGIDTIEVGFLDGQQGVKLENKIDFDTDGMKLKCTHNVAAKAIDWRGMFKNAGA